MPIDTDLPQPGGPQTRPNAPAEGAQWPGEVPGPDEVAGALPQPAPSDPGLPAGVHPGDPSGPESFDSAAEATRDRAVRQGRAPFSTDNGDAFATYERSASNWRAGLIAVNANQGGTAQVVGRLKGRKQLWLWVPSHVVIGGAVVVTPAGVMFADTEGELQGGGGALLNVGDPPLAIDSEAAVCVGLVPGQATGYVQFIDLMNPPGGGITGAT